MEQRTLSMNGVGMGYLVLAVIAALLGGGSSALQSAGLVPASGFWMALEQNHASLMLLFVVIPAFIGGFGTLWLPTALGRAGMVLPRLNAVALGCLAVAGGLMVGAPAHQYAALLLWCAGTLLAAMTLLATLFDSRADGATRVTFSPFIWGEMLASAVLLLTVPVLGALATHQQSAGLPFSTALVEFFAKPVTLVTLLVGFGIVFETVSGTVRFPMRWVVGLMTGAATICTVLWVKAAFAQGSGSDIAGLSPLAVESWVLGATTLASVLLALVWMVGTWRTYLSARVPVLWGLGFLLVVSTGWVSQFTQGGGLHSALQFGMLYAVFCGVYFWRGELCGRWYSTKLATVQFGMMCVATVLALPSLAASTQVVSSTLFTLSGLCFLLTMGLSFFKDEPMPQKQGGARARLQNNAGMVRS
ncbi:heme-copper oxidase family protein [Acetobacter cibinongensis]|uniref:cbb3-type cytochrome c oxidase subunit I n=1 Tax=Acetobacter cibinongensis TaxID=146475 RepID=UPI000A39D33D|nr:cbb3-type cytochrome c oxidase subunit I [Acetobacter cibinongensis]